VSAGPPPPLPAEPTADGGVLDAVATRRAWPDILDAVKARKRATWAMLAQYAQVLTVAGGTLTVGFQTAGIERSFRAGPNVDILREAARDVLGVEFTVETTVSGPQGPSGGSSRTPPRRPEGGLASDEQAPAADDADDAAAADGPGADPVALLGRHLGATVIGEVETG
jgi:DNA polymerase-3 subunit gamma/tau